MELVAVAALAENRVIGDDRGVPWEVPADRRQYRARIAGHPVVLGRVTFESMRESLPGSLQVVMSRSEQSYDVPTAVHAGSVEEAVERASDADADVAYVIGGAGIYRLFLPHLDRMVLSRIPGEYEGDAVFPEWDREEWSLADSTEYDQFTLEEWVRVAPAGG